MNVPNMPLAKITMVLTYVYVMRDMTDPDGNVEITMNVGPTRISVEHSLSVLIKLHT